MAFQRFHRSAIVGMTQSGKTFFLRKAIVPMLGKYVIYDPDFQFSELSEPPHRARIINNYNEFKRLFPIYPRIVFQPRDEMMNNFEARITEFEQICDDINALKEGNLTFVVDEIAYITFKRGKAQVPPNFYLMITRREKIPYRIGVIFTTQRPKHACLDLLTQCRHIYSFKLMNKDTRYVEESFPIKIEGLIKEIPDHACLHYDVNEQKISVEMFNNQYDVDGKTIEVLSIIDENQEQ